MTIAVAIAQGGRGGEVRELGNFINRTDHIGKLVPRLAKGAVMRLGHAAMAYTAS